MVIFLCRTPIERRENYIDHDSLKRPHGINKLRVLRSNKSETIKRKISRKLQINYRHSSIAYKSVDRFTPLAVPSTTIAFIPWGVGIKGIVFGRTYRWMDDTLNVIIRIQE